MTTSFRLLALAASSITLAFGLTACGGGGGSGTTTSTISATAGDKYVGTWLGACTNSAGTSSRGISVITKAGDNLYTLADRTDQYSLPSCLGTTTVGTASVVNFKLTGTISVGALIVDKVATPDFASKDLMYLPTPTTFQVGDPAAGRDVDGYPTGLNTVIATKQ